MALKRSIVSSDSLASLMIDESTDSSNRSKLLLLLRYCEGLQIKEKYLGVCTLESGDAQTIFEKAWGTLCDEGYIMDRLTVVFGDNTPAIQGEVRRYNKVMNFSFKVV